MSVSDQEVEFFDIFIVSTYREKLVDNLNLTSKPQIFQPVVILRHRMNNKMITGNQLAESNIPTTRNCKSSAIRFSNPFSRFQIKPSNGLLDIA